MKKLIVLIHWLLCLSKDGYAQFIGSDLNCSPGVYDGRYSALDAQKRAVFRYSTPAGQCTGCLVNQQVNGKPRQFFLTARHCIYGGRYGEGDLVSLNDFRFQFNFQSPNGNNDNVPLGGPFLQSNRGPRDENFRYGFHSSVNLIYVSTVL